MLLKVTEDVKCLWTSRDSWIRVVIEDDVIVVVFLVGGKEPKPMLVHGRGQGVGLLFGKNNFLTNCSKTMRN
jgi:hypothetical protein